MKAGGIHVTDMYEQELKTIQDKYMLKKKAAIEEMEKTYEDQKKALKK